MTPSPTPAPATPPTTPVARLRNPGELLAALPYLIGFHPRDSLLFIAFGGSSGRRIELPASPTRTNERLTCRRW